MNFCHHALSIENQWTNMNQTSVTKNRFFFFLNWSKPIYLKPESAQGLTIRTWLGALQFKFCFPPPPPQKSNLFGECLSLHVKDLCCRFCKSHYKRINFVPTQLSNFSSEANLKKLFVSFFATLLSR